MKVCCSQVNFVNPSDWERRKIEQCSDCKARLDNAELFRQSTLNYQGEVPPQRIWESIANQTEEKSKLNTGSLKLMFSLAASALICVIAWQSLQNHMLLNELEQALISNRVLEQQLRKIEVASYDQAQILNRVQALEEELTNEQRIDERLILLKRRQALLTRYVKDEKGESHEVSM